MSCQLAGGLDFVSDAPDFGFEGAAPEQSDRPARGVRRRIRVRLTMPGSIEPFEQRSDRARVHVQPGAERADAKVSIVQQPAPNCHSARNAVEFEWHELWDHKPRGTQDAVKKGRSQCQNGD